MGENNRKAANRSWADPVVMYGLRELTDLGIDMRDWILKKLIAKISVKTDGTEKRASE